MRVVEARVELELKKDVWEGFDRASEGVLPDRAVKMWEENGLREKVAAAVREVLDMLGDKA